MTSDKPEIEHVRPRVRHQAVNPTTEAGKASWAAEQAVRPYRQRLARAAEALAEASEVAAFAEAVIDAERAVVAERFLAERQAAGCLALGFALVALACTLTGAPGWVALVFFSLAVSSGWLWWATRGEERAWRAGE